MPKTGRNFLNAVMKTQDVRTGDFSGKVKIVGDDIFDKQGIDPKEFITKTAIKKAFKEAKKPKA